MSGGWFASPGVYAGTLGAHRSGAYASLTRASFEPSAAAPPGSSRPELADVGRLGSALEELLDTRNAMTRVLLGSAADRGAALDVGRGEPWADEG